MEGAFFNTVGKFNTIKVFCYIVSYISNSSNDISSVDMVH